MNLTKKFLILAAGLLFSASPAISATSLPYHNTCDDINTVTVQNEATSAQQKWKTAAYNGNSVFQIKQANTTVGRAIHASIWTPALAIETGKQYKVSVTLGSQMSDAQSEATIAFFDSPNSAASYTEVAKIAPLPTFYNLTRPDAVETVIIGDASRPYLGIIDSGGGAIGFFAVDDIIVEEYAGVSPPKEVDNFETTVNGRTIEISFTLPVQDITGNNLEEISTVGLYRNGELVKTWTSPQPGETLTFSGTVSTAGKYIYEVKVTIGEMESVSSRTVVVAGVSEPSAFSGYGDRDEDGNIIGKNYKASAVYTPGEGIRISWYPKDGEDVLYTVTRIGDRKVIAEKQSGLYAIDTDIDPLEACIYQYEVKLVQGNSLSPLYVSSAVSLNNAVPFNPDVSEDASYEFTIIDADRDTSGWRAYNSISVEKHGVSAAYLNPRCGDDWLITPGIRVEAGKSYRIDVDAFCASIAESNVKLEISAGFSNSPEGQTEILLPGVVFNHMFPRTYNAHYTATESGNLFIGLRSLDPNGTNRFNDLGISRIVFTEIGEDTPVTISDLRMDYSDTPGRGNLTFTAPATTVGGAAITSLARIELYRDSELIKTLENVTGGTVVAEEVTFPLSEEVEFRAVAFTGSASLPAVIKVMQILPPYSNDFGKEEDAIGFTVIEPSLSGYSWSYYPTGQSMRCFNGINDANDDYLLTPALHLEAGNYYKLDFISWLDRADTYYEFDNTIEVLIGNSPEIESLTGTVIEPFELRGDHNGKVLLKNWFTVPETGEYYLAWHAVSSYNRSNEIFIDDINISGRIPDTYPAGVDNFKITPGAEGALNAMVSFDLPTKDMAGREMTSDFYGYRIYCDGLEISNGDGVRGKHIDFVHPTSQGVHLFTVRCFGAANEPTRDVEDVAFVGINRPGAVEFVEVSENPDNYGEITLTWGLPVSDIDGFPLNTENITYTVGQYYVNQATGSPQEVEYATGLTGRSYTKVVKTNADTQEFMRFFVRANTTAGSGSPTVLTKYTAIGKPFELPFKESFRNGNPEHIMMQERPYEGKYASWGYNNYNPVTNVEPVDGDKGLAMMETIEPESGARLFTLRVDLNVDNPVMSFYVYNQSNTNRIDSNILGISVREGNGEFTVVESKSIDEWAHGNPGWQKATVDLSEYARKTVYIGLDGLAKNMTFIHVDNIVIDSSRDIDLTLMGVAHPKVYVGKDHEINVMVKNNGSKDMEKLTVDLMLDGNKIESHVIEMLEAGKIVELSFTNRLGRDAVGRHIYSAEVTADGDCDLIDNIYEAPFFYLQDNDFPTVENPAGAVLEGTTQLAWQLPVLPEEPTEITDDFEGYPSWTTMHTGGLGDYTLVDADNSRVGGFYDHDLPNIPYGSKQSFTLWDFTDEYFAYDQTISDRYKAHSGDKCLVSIYAPGEDSWTEDRLITPLLTGEAQTIRFYAKALEDARPEIFQVYFSYGGTTLADYVDNRFPRQSVGGSWTEFTYDLPEGVKYFVIEHYSNAYTGGYFFFLDDLTYTPVGEETLEIEGYNVYRNDMLLTENPVVNLNYTDTESGTAKDKYSVSVVYDRGESPAVEANMDTTAIGSVSESGVKVYASNGEIVIIGAEGLDICVAGISGMVLTSRRGESDFIQIPVESGIYIVTVGTTTNKIIL